MINDQPSYYFQSRDTIMSQPDSLLKVDSVKAIVKSESIVSASAKTSDSVSTTITPKKTKKIKSSPVAMQDSTYNSVTSDTINTEVENGDKDNSNIFITGTTVLPEPIKRESTSPLQKYNDWLSIFLILSVVIIGFLRISSMKFLRELFNSAFYSQAANKMYSSVNIRNSMPSFVLSILFFVNTGLFIFEALAFYQESIFNQEGFLLLLIIGGILIVYDVIKWFLYRMTGFVFDTSLLNGEYLFNPTMLSQVYAIVLLPIISVIPFVNGWIVPNLIKLGVGMFIVLYIWQLFRGIKIFFQNTFSGFYMFLYFCALEILPLVILYKILFN